MEKITLFFRSYENFDILKLSARYLENYLNALSGKEFADQIRKLPGMLHCNRNGWHCLKGINTACSAIMCHIKAYDLNQFNKHKTQNVSYCHNDSLCHMPSLLSSGVTSCQ